ncbi:LysR substrate-binding domain-containing protein [Arthrobacter sp. Marseille-P9274]|uniref:LysR substrate-binding domain-containing protein n=1 Tax=Arthrobacter sp. Marseille-P9274 TaxID=2866572 RepID=UPI0021C6539B|nr:LysR substrate-binding domain-containing protein [Arthrobacter sp. Marseille-P9274]
MDIRQFQYAITLAETLHFGRAAESLHIAQSAFSTQIARLERQIGAQLFDRSANRVTITAAGEAFVRRAQEILAQVADASQEARILHTASQSQLRIGLFYESAGELTPLIVAAFRKAMPDVELSFRELTMVDQIEAIANEDIDVAFLRSPIADRRVKLLELFAEPRYVGLPAGHALAGQDTIKTYDLVDEAFVVASPMAPPQWRGYWSFDDLRGGPGRIAASVTSVPESLNAIAYQGAVDTFPASATRLHRAPGMVYRRISDGSYSPSALATRTGEHRKHIQAFRNVAQQLSITSLNVVPDAVSVDDAPNGTPRAA